MTGRSIVFAGVDLSPLSTAEELLPAAHGVAVEAREVPGRAGAVLVSGRVPPKPIGVRLFLDLAEDCDERALAAVRHEVAAALASTAGAELALPGEAGLAYRDAVCTDSSMWSRLFEDGSCELAFLALDPIAYGSGARCVTVAEGGTAEALLDVGGTWPTWPVFTVTAAAGGAVTVADAGTGASVSVLRAFAGGEEVVIDCSAGRAFVDGEAADADVSLGSDFFALPPGAHALTCAGCSDFTTDFMERWL